MKNILTSIYNYGCIEGKGSLSSSHIYQYKFTISQYKSGIILKKQQQ